jgi:hypothetical protein
MSARPPGAVGWAWIGFLVVGALSVAGIWTGAVAPHVAVHEDVSGRDELGPRQVHLHLRNERHLAITVTDIDLDVPGQRRAAIELLGCRTGRPPRSSSPIGWSRAAGARTSRGRTR